MTRYIFKFPRCEAESIIVEADTFGEATDKAVAERVKRVTPTKIDGEIHEQKPSLTNPVGGHKEAKL